MRLSSYLDENRFKMRVSQQVKMLWRMEDLCHKPKVEELAYSYEYYTTMTQTRTRDQQRIHGDFKEQVLVRFEPARVIAALRYTKILKLLITSIKAT